MIRAYNEIYLSLGQQNLASMFDYAVYDLSFSVDEFFSFFIASGIADAFSEGDCRYLAGKSGVELAQEVLHEVGLDDAVREPRIRFGKSPVFWTGWVLAYYQWWSALSFDEIDYLVKPSALMELYSPYHEMDICQITGYLDSVCRKETRLKNRRLRMGLSQSALARQSSVPVRTIQQYEQRERVINKAKAETVLALASALCVDCESLMENID